MNARVYKYSLQVGVQQLSFPANTKILSVTEQAGQIVLYALTPPDNSVKSQTVEVSVFETGQTIVDVDLLTFVGTVKMDGGRLMYHVFVANATQT